MFPEMTTSRYYWFCLCATVLILHFADCNGSRGCPMLKCKACEYGYKMARGCRTCECIDPCEEAGMKCDKTERCQKTDVICKKAPCHPVLECVSICPQVRCSTFCPSGFALDSDGCQTCQCIDPCENAGLICNETQRCKETQVQCFVAPCDPILECAPLCPQVRCSRFCASGYALDSNGCQTCQCIDPCENAGKICNATQRCKETQVQCFVAPCDPILECVPQCGPVCEIFCEYGNVLDEYGCPTCNCKDPCKDLGCVAPKVCVPRQVICIRAPCYPIPTCCTPLLTCKLACNNGYATDSDGCQICQCK